MCPLWIPLIPPLSLSHKITTDLLKNTMGFEGLVFSDALNMKGVSAAYPPGTVDSYGIYGR